MLQVQVRVRVWRHARLAPVPGFRDMPERSPDDVALPGQAGRESGDVLEHDGGVPEPGGDETQRKRAGEGEETRPRRPAIPKNAVDGDGGRYQEVVVDADERVWELWEF